MRYLTDISDTFRCADCEALITPDHTLCEDCYTRDASLG